MRIDFDNKDWVKTAENRYNPPLHPRGFIQAQETSQRLFQEKIDNIITSPFLRTLQTAETVAQGLGMKFHVEEGLAEWLREDEFEYWPKYYPREEVVEKFAHFSGEYKSLSPIRMFPESRAELDIRMKKALEGLMARYEGNILIITHASPIDAVFRVLLNQDPDEYHIMCGLSRMDFLNGKWTLGLHKESGHLSAPDNFKEAFHHEV